MTVTLAPATPFTIPRIAQLINKTNQFNLTTRRYTEAQVQAMANDSAAWGVYSVSVADRFGDSGLTGVALVQKSGGVWAIDSFLLSCRVLGRGRRRRPAVLSRGPGPHLRGVPPARPVPADAEKRARRPLL